MKRLLSCGWILALMAASLAPAPLRAQSAATTNPFEKSIQEIQNQITAWDHQASIQIVLVIAVVVFGAVISVLQKSTGNAAKVATVVLGLATSIVTGINAKVFSVDYRSLQRAAMEGNAIVRKLHGMLAVFTEAQPQGADLVKFNADFLQRLDDFNQISKALEGAGSPGATSGGNQQASVFTVPLVYAQSASTAPSWLANLPSDDRSFFYLGKASDASLSTAQADSLKGAMSQITSALNPGDPYSADLNVSTPIKDAAVVQDTYFSYDKQSGAYTYYTLLRLNKQIQNLRLASVRYQQKQWRPVDLTFYPGSGLFVLDDGGAVSRVRIDREGIHLEALFHLKGSDRPASLTANAQSVFASSNNKLGCNVYQYSLDANASIAKATTQRLLRVGPAGCVGIAAEGKSVYLVLPGKKEITYWSDWGTDSTQSWSFQQIQGGGVLTFDRIGQRLVFADDSGSAYSVSVPSGKIQSLASNVGVVHSITGDSRSVLLASGKKVLFYSRSDNQWQNPPSSMQSLTGGLISGVAVDSTGSAWIADFDNGILEGPLALQ